MKNLYGIIGKNEDSNEVINFNHPFRAIYLSKNNPTLKIGNLYIYKKIDGLFNDEIDDKEKLMIKNHLDLYCACYQKGLIKENNKIKKYFLYIKDDIDNYYRFKSICVGSNMIGHHCRESFLYYSDIVQYDSFMPHFSIFNLKIKDNRLIGNFLKYANCLSPNISVFGNVCTGNNKNVSKDGIECLKISNLSSPYNTKIFCNKSYDFYHKCCLVKSKKIYEEVFNAQQ